MEQITNTILMIRPSGFTSNPETAVNNYFQEASHQMLPAVVNAKDDDEVKRTNDWFTHIMELKIKSDPEVAGVYISDEVKQLTKEDLKTVKANNVVMLNKESEE